MTQNVAVVKEYIEWSHPVECFFALADEPWAHIFHPGDKAEEMRYSYICAFPTDKILVDEGALYVNGNRRTETLEQCLRYYLRRRPIPAQETRVFSSGLAGYVGYESAGLFEPVLDLPKSPYRLPDLALGRYEAVAVFDRVEQKAWIAGTSSFYIDQLREALTGPSRIEKNEIFVRLKSESNFTEDAYKKCVTLIREAILNGDFFQANMSQRLEVTLNSSVQLCNFYKSLMSESDAAYGALLQFDYGNILSNSPETFFRLTVKQDGKCKLQAEPIKGTISRSKNVDEDEDLARKLRTSKKDRAENIMIADLLRNDMSRVCVDDTIYEDDICAVMSLTYVHHLVSRISGILRNDCDVVDVLSALFPCGSITGAPKIEAMQAIAKSEKTGRGPYCGAIGFMNDGGGAEFSVAIRTLMQDLNSPEKLTIPVGGGITLRSDAQQEYDETTLKAQGFLRLFETG